MINSKQKAQSAFKKLGAVALITATLTMCFTACKQTGGASLILSPDCLSIKVTAVTANGSAITVEGCTETTLANNVETELHAKGTKVVLRGNITELSCGGNKLTAINVQGLTALKKLNCYNNQLTELNVQGCTSLQELWCSYNQLTAFNVQGCASLQRLICWDNKLTALDMHGLTALQALACSDNQLTSLNVQGLTSLQKLDCSENQLTELNVQGCTALQGLYCDGNQLTSLNVQGLPALKGLGCWSNQLNAQAMTELLKGLPAREEGDKAEVVLYTEEKDYTEGNCTDFTQPAELKTALEGAKSRKWMLQKFTADEGGVDF